MLAYAALAVIACVMIVSGLQAPPERVTVAGPQPRTVSAAVSPEILVGSVLAPRPLVLAPVAGVDGPALAVPEVARPAVSGEAVPADAAQSAPAHQSAPVQQPTAPQQSAAGAAQPPQPVQAGPGKGKGKNKARGTSRVRQVDDARPGGGKANGKGNGKGNGKRR